MNSIYNSQTKLKLLYGIIMKKFILLLQIMVVVLHKIHLIHKGYKNVN